MTGASVDGLVSGLDTSSLISQLMKAEAATQTQLKARASVQQSKISAYSSLNTGLAALQSAAQKLLDPGGLAQAKATSSSGAVSASASAGATPQSFTFSVDRLARAEMHVSSSVTSTSTAGWATGSVSVAGHALDVGTGSMAEVISAVNNTADIGVTAAAVQTGTNEYRLQLTSKTTGQASAFATTGIPGAATAAVLGVDAQITLAPGYTVSSPTNTFTNVLQGVTFSAKTTDPSVTIDVSNDADATAAAVKGLVDAANGVLSQIDKQTAYDTKTKKGSALTGDGVVRTLEQSLLGANGATGGTGSLSSLGITLTSTGSYTFDADAFKKKLAADPDTVTKALTSSTGFASTLKAQAVSYGDAHTGQIAAQITSANDNIKTLDDAIANWDLRLAAKQDAYKTQFSKLEVALGKLRDQSSWLSGQLAGLS